MEEYDSTISLSANSDYSIKRLLQVLVNCPTQNRQVDTPNRYNNIRYLIGIVLRKLRSFPLELRDKGRPPPLQRMDFDVSCDSPNKSLMMRHLGDDF